MGNILVKAEIRRAGKVAARADRQRMRPWIVIALESTVAVIAGMRQRRKKQQQQKHQRPEATIGPLAAHHAPYETDDDENNGNANDGAPDAHQYGANAADILNNASRQLRIIIGSSMRRHGRKSNKGSTSQNSKLAPKAFHSTGYTPARILQKGHNEPP